MSDDPQIIERSEQPYVAIAASVNVNQIGDTLPPLLPEVFAWLDEHGIASAGAPFFKYDIIDMAETLVIEAGVPVEVAVVGDDRVTAGSLTAGRYATVAHVGHPDGLEQATADLLEWAHQRGLEWDVVEADDGEHWASRLEIYLSDPVEEPDMNAWRTELAFRLRD